MTITIEKDSSDGPDPPMVNAPYQNATRMRPPPMPTPDQGVPAFRRQLEIVREYRSIKTIHPAVKAFQQSEADQRMLDTVLNHQYKLMLGRSRDVADCEITVFEAAFMVLMQHVENHCGALYLFVEEILGLKLVAQPQKQEALKQALKVHTLLLHCSYYRL